MHEKMTQPIRINLTYESLIAILQGKEFHLKMPEHHFIFKPPFDGVFITHQQLEEMQFSIKMDTLSILNELWDLRKYKEDRE